MLQLQHQTTPKKPMTQQEHLKRIRARCVELLEIAEKRTAGLWDAASCSLWSANECLCEDASEDNLRFFAACAGAAEAGWKATIAAIDSLPGYASFTEADNPSVRLIGGCAQDGINYIIASWPAELL